MPEFKAFVSDMDDTLLRGNRGMSEYTAATLRRIGRQGVSVVLCSGRAGASITPYVRQAGAEGEMICFNGARVINLQTGELLAQNEIAPETARDMLRWLEARGCYAQFFDGDEWFCREDCQYARDYAAKSGLPAHYTGRPLAECVRNPVPKLLGIGPAERIAQLRAQGQAAFEGRLNVSTSVPIFLEITAPEATKGSALAKLAALRGWTRENVICAGDGLNDLSMLEWTPYSITVADAKPEVLQMAWRVGKRCDEDGIALLLDELIPPEDAQ